MADPQPPELDFAERPRAERWSLRAALTRYAQGQPQRVADLLELVRRIQFALASDDNESFLPGLLDAVREIDALADTLAAWAVDPWNAPRPEADVDAVLASVTERLERLGVPKEERPERPPRGRRRG